MKPEYRSRPSWGAAGIVHPSRVRRYGKTLEEDVPDEDVTPAAEIAGRVAELRARLSKGA